MIHHYLKVAFRNLWKYKSQTLISVVGLAIGFVCFAMATLWIRYEMSYDGFHKNAERLYCVNMPNTFTPSKVSRKVPRPLAGHLKATFPEIADATTVEILRPTFKVDEVDHKANMLAVDSSFLSMFDIKIVEGSMEFLLPESKKVAITREKALQLFGNESPVGKFISNSFTSITKDENGEIIRIDDGYTVCAVVTGFSKRSNYPFDFLKYHEGIDTWGFNFHEQHAIIELVPGIDIKAFEQKLYEHTIRRFVTFITKITITPLTSVYYKDPNTAREVMFQHIIIFAIAGSLLILCTLFNYLTLFISRFRIRQRELALRIVCGASNSSLFVLLSVEFLLSLIVSLLLGLFFIEMIISQFLKLSGVTMELSSIYLELLIYIIGVILISLLTFLLTLAIFRYKTLNVTVHRSNRKMFRKTSIVVQLIISIVFAFCTTIILKQMYHLHNTDLGFAFKNRGAVMLVPEADKKILANKMRQIPEITEVVVGYNPLLPVFGQRSFAIREWDDQQENDVAVEILRINVSEQYLSYYEIKLVEGEMLTDNDDPKYVLINESAAKAFGWNKAVGKSFSTVNNCIVKGVIKNIYSASPTLSARPYCYYRPSVDEDRHETIIDINEPEHSILFKYNEGTWQTCKEKIEAIFKEQYTQASYLPEISNTAEEYERFLKSENTLLKLLTLVSLVCVLVCVFGFVSMVSLTCEERRKEIAIRKINGATVKDILDIFFKEHLTLLAVGALIAFPIGYLIMKHWLEQYVVQTEMSAWVYVSILLALFMAIALCVGEKVYKTSRENPINAINR